MAGWAAAGVGAADALTKILAERRQRELDAEDQANTEIVNQQKQQQLAQAAAKEADARARQQAQDARQSKLDDRKDYEDRQAANQRGVADMLGQAITQQGVTDANRNQLTGMAIEAGQHVSPLVGEALKPPPPPKKPLTHLIKVPGKNGPNTIAVSEDDPRLQTGIQTYEPPKAPATDKLVKVEHKDPDTGRTVIEWLPQSELRGQKFDKGVSATTDSRLASAEAVNQTGQDIIAKLSDPTIASKVGPAIGRYNSLRDFIGNPPPEYADLAGQIESYAIANMGVHGMRSAQGADHIKALLDKRHTPASLIATIQGLNSFSQHFMENEGRKSQTSTAPPPAAKKPTAAELLKKYGAPNGG